ncbi:Conserved hypothetical protein [gamma proteobacterium HdN1]|nr:Conserved hypothetical protein [gamma proteobacterium HdN1]
MMTYLYWLVVISIICGFIYLLGAKLGQWLYALIISVVLLGSSASFYYFYLQQMLVKRWGGVMSITIPEGMHHVAATWKDDHLWIENYDPTTNTCIFQEYSRGNLLQGEVRLKNCNPVARSN